MAQKSGHPLESEQTILTRRQRRQWLAHQNQLLEQPEINVNAALFNGASSSRASQNQRPARLSQRRPASRPSPKRTSGHSPQDWRRRKAIQRGAAQRVPQARIPRPQPVENSPPHPWVFFLLTLLRLMIMGVGVAAIAGTILSIWNPASRISKVDAPAQSSPATAAAPVAEATPSPIEPVLKPELEMSAVKQQIQSLAAAQSELTPGFFFLNLDTGAYLDLAGSETFSAASMIKVPVLVAFFQDVDAGKIQLNEELVMRPDLIASEAGEMQYQPPNTKFSALETASLMIIISDNTATNMLIDRMGGIEALNQRFRSWGLTKTVLRNPLPDLEGTNTASPQELSLLMARVGQGELVTPRSRDRLLDIMRQTVTDTLLPQGLGEGATIAHKTGDIGTVVGDVGLIDMPNGQRYVATAVVKRPYNDPRAQELIRQTSRLVYQFLSQSRPQSPPAAN